MDYNFVIDVRDDKRYEYLAKRLTDLGYDVFCYENFVGGDAEKLSGADYAGNNSEGNAGRLSGAGYTEKLNGYALAPSDNNAEKLGRTFLAAGNAEKLNGANLVYILPPSVRLSADDAEKLLDGSTLFAFAQRAAADTLLKKNIKFVDVFAEERFAYKNAMITADGALMLVAENTDIVFFDMKILVVGFGRVGKSIIRIFKPLSGRVDVLTFDRGECAAATLFSDGQYCSFEDVKFDMYDVVINTVPAQLINRHVVARFKEGAFLLELASEPGGFDRDAVKKDGIKFLRAAGLPAKVAPVSAGKILLEEIAGQLGIKY
jgi:dipicolinic acid synthetase A subunit